MAKIIRLADYRKQAKPKNTPEPQIKPVQAQLVVVGDICLTYEAIARLRYLKSA